MIEAHSAGNPANLTILGVIHRDREGASILARYLDDWMPAAVTVEFSDYGLKYREAEGEVLRRRVYDVVDEMKCCGREVDGSSLEAVLAYLEPPCEFVVASDYAVRSGLPLYLIDDDRYSRSKLADIEELISRENLEKLLSGPLQNDCKYQRTLARLFFDKGIGLCSYTEEMETRDRIIRDRIRTLMLRHQGGRLLHICGWEHLRDPRGVYEALNPMKVFIYDQSFCL